MSGEQGGEVRKRLASSRLLESDEPLAKKLRAKKANDKQDGKGPQTSQSSKSKPQKKPQPPAPMSRQTSTTSLASTRASSPAPSIEEEQDPDYNIELRGPIVRQPGRLVEAADGSDDEPDADDVDGGMGDGEEGGGSNPQARLDALYKTYKSPIYVFFLPPLYVAEKGKEFHVFKCAAKHCKCLSREVRRNINTANATSTSNLRSHAIRCWGDEVVKLAMKVKSVHEAREVLKDKNNLRDSSIRVAFQMAGQKEVTYSDKLPTRVESRLNHVKWVAGNNRPFSVVEDEGYHRNMKTGPGRKDTYIPSAATVSRDVKTVFLGAREKISWLLRNQKSRLHFATDCWTSPNRRAYMAVTVQFEKNGAVEEWLLDIVEVARQHTGLQLAIEFTKILQEFGLIDKILSITCDNATNNDVLTEKMGEMLTLFQGDGSRVRCFAHVVNLVAKTVLSQFDLPKKKKNTVDAHEKTRERSRAAEDELDDLDEDGFEVSGGDEGVDVALGADIDDELAGGDAALAAKLREIRCLAGKLDADLQRERDQEAPEMRVEDEEDDGWIDERWEMDAEDLRELTGQVMPVRGMLVKLRKIAFATKNSPTVVAPRWRDICEACGLKERNIPTDVRTRWNSTYDLLEFAINYSEAIDRLTSERSLKLRKYELDAEEWTLARQLATLLKTFKHATTFFSEAETSNITYVVPTMDHFDEVLATASINPNNAPGIRAAASLGKQTLNRYYSKTDTSEVYRIAMVLNPRYKLAYFRKVKWEEAWINTAQELVTNAFRTYEDDVVEVEPEGEDDTILMVDNPQLHTTEDPKTSNMFADYLESVAPAPSSFMQVDDELEDYLSRPVESLKYKDKNGEEKTMTPMEWWVRNRDKYPRLSRMALDYLSIPATAVDVERVFSKGRMSLTYLRNRLSVQTFRSIMCLNEWLSRGLLKDKEMISWLQGFQDIIEEDEEDVAEGWDHISQRFYR